MNATTASSDAPSSLYRAVWRWHFYAGLMVLPFMVLLAITGGLYLFHNEIDALWHRDLKQVAVRDTAPLPPGRLIDAALGMQPGTALKITMPARPNLVRRGDGEDRRRRQARRLCRSL